MTQVLEHLFQGGPIYSVIRLREVSNRCHLSVEMFKVSELQPKSAWLRLT